MQHKLSEGLLLNESGNLNEAGYAFQLVKKYERKAIKANKLRIKEWDYYYVGNNEYGIAVTIADNSYMWLCTASVLDFKNKWEITKSKMGAFSNGKLKLPETSDIGDCKWSGKDFSFEFKNNGKERHLIVTYKKFRNDEDLNIDIKLTKTINDTMVIATPWDKDKHFYYNQKINCLKSKGSATLGNTKYNLNNCYGVLDWGRGVWTYKNTWYWSSMSGIDEENNPIGFNLGYGFGNTSAASENMFFYKDKAYKLEDVIFDIPQTEKGKDDFMKEWKVTSKDKSINLTFTPVIDRYTNTNVLIIHTIQHQVFGIFNGTITVENKTYKINNILSFAEKVYMKY